MLADHAHVGGGLAVGGATLFDGDRLVTDGGGSLQAKLGAAQLILMGASAAAVTRMGRGARAQLLRGTAMFSSASAESFEVDVADAVVRAHGAHPAVGQVTLASAKEFVVTCAQGALDVNIGAESRIITAPNSYRVVIENADPQEPEGAGTKHARAGGKRRMEIVWIGVGIISVVTIWGVWRVLHKVSND